MLSKAYNQKGSEPSLEFLSDLIHVYYRKYPIQKKDTELHDP